MSAEVHRPAPLPFHRALHEDWRMRRRRLWTPALLAPLAWCLPAADGPAPVTSKQQVDGLVRRCRAIIPPPEWSTSEVVEVVDTPERAIYAALDWLAARHDPVTIHLVMRAFAAVSPCSVEALKSPRRHQPLVHYRQAAMALARGVTGRPLTKIGQKFGGRDHTTVLHACNKFRAVIERALAIGGKKR